MRKHIVEQGPRFRSENDNDVICCLDLRVAVRRDDLIAASDHGDHNAFGERQFTN